jgi:hypothetical protein
MKSYIRWSLCTVLAVSFISMGHAGLRAQEGSFLQAVMQSKAEQQQVDASPVVQASCTSCGTGFYGSSTNGLVSSGCGSCGLSDCGGCGSCGFPGQTCNSCVGSNSFENFFCQLHNAVCCPDPCYEPTWIAAQNAAFFQDSARPVSQTRIRWDRASSVRFPDRNNYLMAPTTNLARLRGIDYDELRMSIETATERFSLTVDTPYRHWTGDGENKSGFGDIAITTKSLLIDSEFLLMTFQFRTNIPSASGGQGLGLGLVALEPSLLFTLKLCQDTYLQTQLAQWIPLGGSDTAGSIFRSNFALNHLLWQSCTCRDMQLVGTLELNCLSFQAGHYNAIEQDALGNDVAVLRQSSGDTYISVGPGIRYQLCEKMDFGVGVSVNVSQDHFAEQLYRTEFRWRF